MNNPGAPRPLEHRYSNHPMLAHEEPDELDQIEVRKKDKPMGICKVEGCGKKVAGRGLCSTHYMQERTRAQKEGTWKPAATRPKAKEKAAETEPKPAREAVPLAAHPTSETTGPEPVLTETILPGDLYIVAKIPLEQIRVMTVEQLREMCRAGHA